MPKKGQYTEEFDRCVQKVKAQGKVKNPYAICMASFRKAGKKIWIGEGKLNRQQMDYLRQLEKEYHPVILAWIISKASWYPDV